MHEGFLLTVMAFAAQCLGRFLDGSANRRMRHDNTIPSHDSNTKLLIGGLTFLQSTGTVLGSYV